MNINNLIKRQYINIEQEKDKVQAGTGTREEIIRDIYSGKIIPLTDNRGEIIGISVNSEVRELIDDNIAQVQFQKRYQGTNLMNWVYEGLQAKYDGIALEEALKEPERNQPQRECCEHCNSDCGLPSEVQVDVDDIPDYDTDYDVDDSDNINAVKRYLRGEYGHYLNKENPFDLEMDSDGETLYISDITWGRKIS